MINPVTDKHKEHYQSRTLGYSYILLMGDPSQPDFGWRDMSWDRKLPDDFVSNFVRMEIGFRLVRNKQ